MSYVIGFLAALVLAQSAWIVRQQKELVAMENQNSKLVGERDSGIERYDELVQQIKTKAGVQPIDKPEKRRIARTFSEFRDADERGVMPRGMKEKRNGT
jgi:hypothetical protein